MVGSKTMGQAVMQIILDERAFQVPSYKQAKLKCWAGTMPALLCDVPSLPFFAKKA